MLTKTHDTPGNSPFSGVVPDPTTDPLTNGSPVATDPDVAAAPNVVPEQASATAETGGESRRDRSRRKAHRNRLHAYAIATVALVAYLIALAASNTAHVKVNWVFGTSHVSLVWLVLFTAIVGWLLGLAVTAAFRWRTRAPRSQQGAPS